MTTLARPPQSICVIRMSAVGDVVNTVPIVAAVRDTLPETRITWIIGATEYDLAKHLTEVEFIRFDKAHPLRAWAGVHRQLRRRQFDALLLMQYSLRAHAVSLLVRSPHRIGYRHPRSHEMHKMFINHRVGGERQHVVETLLDFAAAIGVEAAKLRPLRCWSDADALFAKRHLPDNCKTLLISPCASEPFKQWTNRRYAMLANYAVAKHAMQIVLSGCGDEDTRHCCTAIKMHLHQAPIDLTGQTNLNQLAALIAQADVVLSPDSAAAHIASAVGTPVIGLYAGTNPERAGPYNSRQWCINRYPDAARATLRDPNKLPWGAKIRQRRIGEHIGAREVCAMLDRVLDAINQP